MDKVQKIIVGLDLCTRGDKVSTGSQKALAQASWLAERFSASIALVHSTYRDRYTEPVEGRQVIVHQGLSDEGAAALEGARSETQAAGIDCELIVSEERPWIAVTHAATSGGADLVVVGKRNEEQAEGRARKLGSVATKLLRKCPLPVWVVKPEHDLVLKLVLSATDLTVVGQRAVQFGAFVAAQYECELHVVHAYQIPLELQMESARIGEDEYAQQVEAIKSRALQAIQDDLKSLPFEHPVEPVTHIGRNTGSAAIKEAVEHLHPDLLVMGTVSRGGMPGVLVGNTCEKILDQVDCSMLAIKPDDFVSPLA